MIVTREDVLHRLAWQERVAVLGASQEVRDTAKLRVEALREQLHQIEEQSRAARAEARVRARLTAARVTAFLWAFAAGAITHAEWPRLLALLAKAHG